MIVKLIIFQNQLVLIFLINHVNLIQLLINVMINNSLF